ncbi:MAG: bifunctional DNA-formamidopyrimidine glycosylase/DNA-(apurinic or apyrimidinic site) lyase [Desulfocapsa sp.]|nr:bifunctional DNA-formamidopyrimidine glycosylase/DNA-(apurinic or apyrimidinic site) lyase [Desulfocapsa sp.]
MPELPEVEVICKGLLPHLINRTIVSVYCSGKQLRYPVPCREMQRELCKKKIISLSRRAKYLILRTDRGGGLIIHLGMTGNLGIFKTGSATKKHDHVCWELDNNTELRFNDTRRFGAVYFFTAKEITKAIKHFFANTGPEPFSRACSVQYLSGLAARRNIAIKQFIMDNHMVAGIGNIYANESLFRSGIHPERAASSLSAKEWKRLLTVIRQTLTHAIKCGGSTISDFLGASGDGGYFQINFRIYGKSGEKCSECGGLIMKKNIGGRASFFCPVCQKIVANHSRR